MAAYGQGATLVAVVRRFDVHRQAVQRHLADRGVLLRARLMIDDGLADQLAAD